jgi:predicted nucleic acid-binding protein
MFILDTNVISELRHGKPQQSAEVRAWAAGQPSSRLFLSAISILELEIGIRTLERRVPPAGQCTARLAGRGACGLRGPHPAIHRRHRARVRFTAHTRPPL